MWGEPLRVVERLTVAVSRGRVFRSKKKTNKLLAQYEINGSERFRSVFSNRENFETTSRFESHITSNRADRWRLGIIAGYPLHGRRYHTTPGGFPHNSTPPNGTTPPQRNSNGHILPELYDRRRRVVRGITTDSNTYASWLDK